ncbi:MAG: Cupin region [Candidatus Shapirobacteria bacterium GW2011_GWE1_38_10]|uniref:Cupin region n=1 Tax=Candidatus Shapirobacteria bacterium GW2011_GWE1_38_10 TaxID=1618488 RepID=A0A0G0LCL5_9BACT|nr:MAG: Cupin region [Candidatus Shapirobacteria bacterium GW2011_GWF2_37_20]KKQ50396.1 MAG: Cupin region [Candidatus Shapirobacteria bacterium GW2011_GWE1_38_10]KKQ65221.1 MAG: Cupin region [Candidatus Shapirobacteria bacterium GW2011_GWF1_38_23]HBP51203.1 cupin [Candidatus Shapirobacteria bacterium]
MTAQIVDKPWGREIILTTPDLPYVAKILEIKAQKRLSLQYHDQKLETLTLFSGEANIIWGKDKDNLVTEKMIPNNGYTIAPNTIHRFEAITDCQIFEASTGEIGTTFRLEDDVNRPNETEEIRNSPNRGWTQK